MGRLQPGIPVVLASAVVVAGLILNVTAFSAEAAQGAYTAGQAARGKSLYSKYCASCHGDALQGGAAPALAGKAFIKSWGQSTRTVDDLFYVMRSSMPKPAMGSLVPGEYLELVAFVLSRNGLPAGEKPLSADAATLNALRLASTAVGTDGKATSKKTYIVGTGSMKPIGTGPSEMELRDAEHSSDWLYHTHDLHGTRYAPLNEINRSNVAQMQVACIYQLGSTENFLTGPIVHAGIMYVTTVKLTVAIDAATCREKWRQKWEAQDADIAPNNRGVAIENGYVVRGTSDGYLLALDAADGRLLWARQVARPAVGESIVMPPLIYGDLVLIGPAVSEFNVQGWIGAFRLSDGAPVWRFNTIPKAGEPGFETWNNDPNVPVGGGAVWSPLAVDMERGEVYVPVTNPAPDFAKSVRPGKNLYTNSLVALDLQTGKLKWYVQMDTNDDKDYDLTQVSPLIEATVGGRPHKLVVTAGKDGIVRVLDRDTHEVLHQTPIGTRLNEQVPITREGTHYCPGTLGGIQWNGPSWNAGMNMLFVPSVDWCWTAKLDEKLRNIPGSFYMGGSAEPDKESHGLLTAIDASSGAIRWQYRSEKPMVAAVTTTAGGLLFTGESTGDFLGFDAEKGTMLYRFNTGGAMTGGVITYAVSGRQYVGAASGKGSIFFGGDKGAPTIVVFKLPDTGQSP
jgi:alcohol dehydrogenase (cytochrome c)